MPAKDEIQLGPDRFGLSEKEVMFLLVFRELGDTSASPADIFEVVREELATIERGRARSYFYNVVSQMESFGWIETVRSEKKNNKKYYAVTKSGKEKVDSLRESCMNSILNLKKTADHFAYHITGVGNSEPNQLSPEQRKMFSRLINVRHLIRFLVLKTLSEKEHRAETGKNIYRLFKERYHWQPAEGYFYELAREMETEQGYISGEWTTSRRNSYVYRITELGKTSIEKEAKSAMYFIKQLQKYTQFILNLFPEHHKRTNTFPLK